MFNVAQQKLKSFAFYFFIFTSVIEQAQTFVKTKKLNLSSAFVGRGERIIIKITTRYISVFYALFIKMIHRIVH